MNNHLFRAPLRVNIVDAPFSHQIYQDPYFTKVNGGLNRNYHHHVFPTPSSPTSLRVLPLRIHTVEAHKRVCAKHFYFSLTPQASVLSGNLVNLVTPPAKLLNISLVQNKSILHISTPALPNQDLEH
jgi:hypothetical protein